MAATWIAFAGGIFAAVLSAVVALRQSRMAQELARVNHDLDAELHRREALIDQQMRGEEVLTTYRQPLAAAAFDLQSRLYNIVRLDFFGKFGGDHERSEDALRTTLFRFAQYFGWTEILRRDVQFLSFPQDDETRRVAELQAEITKCLLTDSYGPALMIWSDEQRGIGEQMIVEEHGKVLCMGYARFRERCDQMLEPVGARLSRDMKAEEALPRLRDAQHLLCELVEVLDARRVRYRESLERA